MHERAVRANEQIQADAIIAGILDVWRPGRAQVKAILLTILTSGWENEHRLTLVVCCRALPSSPARNTLLAACSSVKLSEWSLMDVVMQVESWASIAGEDILQPISLSPSAALGTR
jgi:hypothetical protein